MTERRLLGTAIRIYTRSFSEAGPSGGAEEDAYHEEVGECK
jgi:hypothetical protein